MSRRSIRRWQGNAELRELAHGIHPSVLTRVGLRAGIDTVVWPLGVPVHMDVTSTRRPPEIEASAYFIVAEALSSVVKHSHATEAEVTVTVANGTLSVNVRDDGVGAAGPEGHGLLGISDRADALGGRLYIDSPSGRAPSWRRNYRCRSSVATRAGRRARRAHNGDHIRPMRQRLAKKTPRITCLRGHLKTRLHHDPRDPLAKQTSSSPTTMRPTFINPNYRAHLPATP